MVATVNVVVSAGPDSIVVSGATVSIFQLRVAGVESASPEPFKARTAKVCSPSERAAYFLPEPGHGAKAALSRRHSKPSVAPAGDPE